MNKNFFLLLIIFFLSKTNYAYSEKIAYINIDILLKNSNQGLKISKELEKLNNKNLEELKLIESQIREKESELNKVKNVISNDELTQRINALKEEINLFNNNKEKLNIEFREFRQKKIQNFLIEVDPVIKNYMKDNDISLLLEKKNIYIGLSDLDITNNILKKLEN